MKPAVTILTITAGITLLAYLEHLQRKGEPNVIPLGSLPFDYNAMTVPPIGIFIRKDQISNQALLDHERVHWSQYQDRGLFGFYTDYYQQARLYGYDAMPMELEARQNESPYCQCNYTQCVRSGIAKTVSNPNFRS